MSNHFQNFESQAIAKEGAYSKLRDFKSTIFCLSQKFGDHSETHINALYVSEPFVAKLMISNFKGVLKCVNCGNLNSAERMPF